MKLKCHNCGAGVEFSTAPKEFVCPVCGAVNVVPVYTGVSDEELGCLAPTGFEWTLPTGKNGNPITGFEYVTAQGTHMTREEYIQTFGVDPEIALQYMRCHKGVRIGGGV